MDSFKMHTRSTDESELRAVNGQRTLAAVKIRELSPHHGFFVPLM